MKSPPPLTIEEIRAQHQTGRVKCSLEEFVRKHLTKADARVLVSAFNNPELQVSAIFRVLEARGFTPSEQVLRRHRKRVCVDCAASWLKPGTE